MRRRPPAWPDIATDGDVNPGPTRLLRAGTDGFDRLLGKNQWQSLLAFQARDDSYRFSADRYNEYWTLVNATNASHNSRAAGRDAIRNIAATVIGGNPTDAQLQAYVDQRFLPAWAKPSAPAWAPAGRARPRSPASTPATTWRPTRCWAICLWQLLGRRAAAGTRSVRPRSVNPAPAAASTTSMSRGAKVTISSNKSSASLGRDNGYLTCPWAAAQRRGALRAVAGGGAGRRQVMTNAQGQITGLRVRTRAFFVEARDQFDASAQGQLFVRGRGALLGAIASNGSGRLSAQTGITAGVASSPSRPAPWCWTVAWQPRHGRGAADHSGE